MNDRSAWRVATLVTVMASALGAVGGGCGDGGGAKADVGRKLVLAFDSTTVPTQAAGGSLVTAVAVAAKWDDGAIARGVGVEFAARGGGSATSGPVTTDNKGIARGDWTLGSMPIVNTLVATAADADARGEPASATMMVDPAAAIESAPFGDVEAYLAARGSDGSTEDLAFAPDGRLVMGHGGANAGLFEVAADGKVTALATSGEAIKHALGLAFDKGGALYVADSDAKALLKVAATGVVTKLQDRDGDELFASPNDVAVGADGTVFVSDTCTGKLYAVDARTGNVKARVALDAVTQGGPNGVVVGPDGAVWMTSENPAIFCSNNAVGLTDEVAGLFRIAWDGARFGEVETVESGVGVFGDGLAFDEGGNLYVIFDTVDGLKLDESIVFVRPAGGGPLVRALSASGKVYANIAFGPGGASGGDGGSSGSGFGATTMYLALLQVVLVPDSPRGLERVDVGVRGAALPPE